MENRSDDNAGSNVVDFTGIRARRSDDERRNLERYFLRDIIQLFCVIDDKLLPIELLDASAGGCAFRVPFELDIVKFAAGEDLALRMYFSRETYLLLGLKVASAVVMAEEGRRYMRYGCSVDPEYASFPAYRQLMKFIETYSNVCRKERNRALG